MYEPEVNRVVESLDAVPPDVRRRFAEFRDRVIARTTLPWGEHCTECVWPTCYTTCELYSPRSDGACRQFVDGMVRIDHRHALSRYLLKLRFKPWAKLWTVGNLHLHPLAEADRRERVDIAVGAVGRNLPIPRPIKARVLRKVSHLRRRAAAAALPTEFTPDCFLMECFNPNQLRIELTFTVRAAAAGRDQFQTRFSLVPGFTRATTPVSEIARVVDLGQPFEVEIAPNGADNTVLYFGLIDFVKQRQEAVHEGSAGPTLPAMKWKCIVWDLDNTLWDGVLVEDGPEKIRLREGVVDAIRRLDERGILHSVASKNNLDDVIMALRAFGIDQYFLYPQVHWQPKSKSVAQIAKLLNIGLDSMAFVDDQPFEREEVKTALPQLAVVDAVEAARVPSRAECDVPVTAESRNRRLMYREQEQRQAALESASGDYYGFLRSCQMVLRIGPLSEGNLRRVYELAQRTNQLNFSGNRYSEDELREIMASPGLDTYVIDCSDRFGDYGIIGFAIVDTTAPRLLDLMFSCRIQSKRVEHAVLSFLLRKFVGGGCRDFHANYRRTEKNAPGGRVFEELGFESLGEDDGVASLIFRKEGEIVDDGIVQIEAHPARRASGVSTVEIGR